MPTADKEPIFLKIDRFRKLFTLLVFKKSNSQNNPVYIFHASKNPDRTQIPPKTNILFIRGPAAGAKP